MSKEQLLSILFAPALYVTIGLVGSALEALGAALGLPRLVSFGKTLEAIAADVPKALANLKGLFSGSGAGALGVVAALGLSTMLCACPPGTAGGTAGGGGSSSVWSDVARCAPSVPDVIGDVTQILLSGGNYEQALEDLALKTSGDAVVCAVNKLVSDWSAPGAAVNTTRSEALARGRAFLAKHPAQAVGQ